MGFKPTPSQQSAIDARDRTLLISAAAGSGKTATLTQRIIQSIIKGDQDIQKNKDEHDVSKSKGKRDISKLLIVTYTRSAASQLREKIAKALNEAIANDPKNIDLQKQLIKLGQAHISTIDSFFADPVKANFEKLGLPASIRMADDAELSPIRHRLMNETFEEFFSECEAYRNSKLSDIEYRTRFTELVGVTVGARDISGIIPEFWNIYTKLITSPISIKQLKVYAERFKNESMGDPFDSVDGKFIKKKLYSHVKYVRSTFLKLIDEMQSDAFICSKYQSDFARYAKDCSPLLDALENGGYEEIRLEFSKFKPKDITSINSEDKTPTSEYFFKERKKLNDSISDLYKNYLLLSKEEFCELLNEYSYIALLLYDILSRFDKKYTDEKKSKGICEFSDMPKYLMELLTVDGDIHKETEYAKTLRDSFQDVYIDEYQDVNEIQDAIFAIIGKDHRFMVGDIKQSIYGFRDAEPNIFSEYRERFPVYDENIKPPKDEFGGNTIFMSENFRCDQCVIDFTNLLCSNVFSALVGDIKYDPEADNLRPGRDDVIHEPCKVELTVIETPPKTDEENPDKKVDSMYDESVYVANKIADLIRTGRKASNPKAPIKPGEIAVLVRSMNHATQLMKALDKLNIKYAASKKGSTLESVEMKLLFDILSVIDNPRSDVPLYNVLSAKNEFYEPEFTVEELTLIHKHSDRVNSLYDALIDYSDSGEDKDIRNRCDAFISRNENLRKKARGISADKLIKDLMFCEKYSSLARTDAYTYIFNSACSFVSNNWGSLYSFLNYFNNLMKNTSSGKEPIAEDENSVKIMTIHQSKGLEFNTCFLLGFGKHFQIGEKDSFIFLKGDGAYVKLPPKKTDDPLNDIRVRFCNNPIFTSAAKRDYQKQLEEEARVFYVALTRAAERLYISATVNKTYDEYTDKLVRCADRDYEINNSTTFISWMLLILSKLDPKDYESFCKINVVTRGDLNLTFPFTKAEREQKTVENADKYEEDLVKLVEKYSSGKSERQILFAIPSKVAASKISEKMLDQNVFTVLPNGKVFSEDDEKDIDALFTDTKKRIRSRIELMKSAPAHFEELIGDGKKSSAAEKGTAMHAFLQFCNFKGLNADNLEEEITRLVDEGFISSTAASDLNRKHLMGFLESDIFKAISSAKDYKSEFRFGMYMPAEKFTQNTTIKKAVSGKSIYVQGSIDLLIEDNDGEIILCDYKTDRVTSEEFRDRSLLIANVKAKHQSQLDQYAYAITEIFKKAPKKRYIYLFNINETIEI